MGRQAFLLPPCGKARPEVLQHLDKAFGAGPAAELAIALPDRGQVRSGQGRYAESVVSRDRRAVKSPVVRRIRRRHAPVLGFPRPIAPVNGGPWLQLARSFGGPGTVVPPAILVDFELCIG